MSKAPTNSVNTKANDSILKKVPQVRKKPPSLKPQPATSDYQIGVFYMPGWYDGSVFWRDLLGTNDSRSPERTWDDRIPLLGIYPEGETWVVDWHIKWAVEHGISFFVYDWFWRDGKPHLDHTISAHLDSQYKNLLKFCVMWTNHEPFIPKMKDVPHIIQYFIDHYFNQSNYLMMDDKPVVMVFLPDRIGGKPNNTIKAIKTLRDKVKKAGYKDIFLVAISNDIPATHIIQFFKSSGYDAYTPYNYTTTSPSKTASYDMLMTDYQKNWRKAYEVGELPYIVSVTPGWDSRPWHGEDAFVRTGSTPEKFKTFLQSAKDFLNQYKRNIVPKMILIEAWNEFAEGAYIEPTKKWGFGHLDAIRRVFTNAPIKHLDEYPEAEE